MLQPFKIDMYFYANSPEEAIHLSNKMRDFVSEKRNQGIVVSADKLSKAIDMFGNNPLLLNYLK